MDPLQEHALKIERQKRRVEMANKLPNLAIRIFALDKKNYKGSGFYWSLVKSIGGLLYKINNYNTGFTDEDMEISDVLYEDLVERVEAAEKSAKESEQHEK